MQTGIFEKPITSMYWERKNPDGSFDYFNYIIVLQ
jgi:hypothetical protein